LTSAIKISILGIKFWLQIEKSFAQ
jgi:hypothetical protein